MRAPPPIYSSLVIPSSLRYNSPGNLRSRSLSLSCHFSLSYDTNNFAENYQAVLDLMPYTWISIFAQSVDSASRYLWPSLEVFSITTVQRCPLVSDRGSSKEIKAYVMFGLSIYATVDVLSNDDKLCLVLAVRCTFPIHVRNSQHIEPQPATQI